MAVLGTSNITLPKKIAAGLIKTAVGGSTVAALSGSEPQQFGDVTLMTLTARPRAEFVGEGADKAGTNAGFGSVTVKPHKAQVTMRFNEEVQWADEDYQLGVLSELGTAGGEALARALDFGIYHAINPLTGTAAATISEGKLNDTTNRVEVAGSADTEVEAAVGLLMANSIVPNGIALDPKYAWTLSTARYSDGRKKFPDLGFGTNITNFQGLPASVSDTVSGLPEATDTKLRAMVGDFQNGIRWGIQRRIPVELIKFGDPDGQGDLKRKNQVALRLEVVYGWYGDKTKFAAINDLV